jgi:Protein of unknown function (DUF3667)
MIEPSTESHICKSCSNAFTGNFCNQCGEKVLRPSDRSFKKFIGSILVAITFADTKSIKTLWVVLKRPGHVSKEIAAGKTIMYLKPISLFFVLNLIYFFFPVIQLFNATLKTQLSSPLRDFYKNIVAHKIVSLGMNIESFNLVYNIKTTGYAKLMVMVFAFLGSLPLNFFYWRKKRFFSDNVSYMVEVACFNLFVNAIVLTIVVSVFGLGKQLDETVLTIIFICTNLYFLFRSSHEFYGERGWRLVLKSVVMILFLKVALELYRMVLFFVTIWSM